MTNKRLTIDDDKIRLVDKAMREQGLFVTCGKNPPNLMVTHWGTIGYFWGKWVFILPVRYNKFSHDIIDQTKEFSVSVPFKDLRYYIMKVESISGREHDKFGEFHLHPIKTKSIDSFVVGDCGLHLECKVIYIDNMGHSDIADSLKNDMYATKNLHTMYYGEIVNIY